MAAITFLHCIQSALCSTRAARSIKVSCLGLLALVLVLLPSAGASAGTGAGKQPSPTSTLPSSPSSEAAVPIAQSFRDASARWGVPLEVLMAVGYAESHWEQRPGEPSIDGGFGVMHLVEGQGGTLQQASQLTGVSQDRLKTSASANIEGGAAILNSISQRLHASKMAPGGASGWYAVVAAYSGAADAGVAASYAQQVFAFISSGVTATLSSGERVVLQARPGVYAVPDAPVQPESPDYGPALWAPASPSNYTAGRPYGPLTYIVIHDTEGSYSSSISWFQNPSSGVSAHYIVRSSDGQITQLVRDADTAWHTGVWDYNVKAIGVEHEGYASQQGWYTEPQYQASAALVSTLADRYGIKKDRAHIIGHYQIPNQDHHDPGPYWDWVHYMSLVRQDSLNVATIDNTDSGFAPAPAQLDPDHSWYTYGNGYNGSSTLSTLSAPTLAASTNSATWSADIPTSGYYHVYAYVPYVDNSTPDTELAHYTVYTANGTQNSLVSQKSLTDLGVGSWADVGQYYFDQGLATVGLSDYTGETGHNVWFDALMWVPVSTSAPPPATVTATVPPAATSTRRPTATRAPLQTSTSTPQPTDTPTAGPTWTPGPCNMRFLDLPDTSWAYSYVANLYCRDIVSGYSDGTFRPNADNTRGQFTKMLALSFAWSLVTPQSPSFSDVPPGSPFYSYIETARSLGVLGGYSDGTFRSNDPLTRAQAVKMIMVAHGWPPEDSQPQVFTDIPPEHWAFGYIQAAYSHGIINGYADGTFRPQDTVTRAQVAKLLTLAAGPMRK